MSALRGRCGPISPIPYRTRAPDFLPVMSDETDVSDVSDSLRRWRALDGMDKLRMRVHRAVRTAEEIMLHEDTDDETRLSAARAVVTAAREHRKMIEVEELEARVERLENLHDRLTTANGTP